MDKIDLINDINIGLSSYEISKKRNKSQTTISYWLKKYGLKTTFQSINNGYRSPNSQHFKLYKSKYECINWHECQKLYDEGLSWNDLIRIGYTHNSLYWAYKNKKLLLRSISNAQKLAWNQGKQKAEIYQTIEHRKIMSKFGGYKKNSGKCKYLEFQKNNGNIVSLQGTWEYRLATFLENKNITWIKNTKGFPYVFNNKEKKYFPDFYINEWDIFIEVKGYETEMDREKWKQFPHKLLIIKKNEINNLNEWFDHQQDKLYIKRK